MSKQAWCPKRWQVDFYGILAVIALGALMWFAEISQVLRRHALAKADTVQLRSLRDEERSLEQALVKVQAEIDQAREAQNRLDLKLRPADDLNRTLAMLAEFAAENGLSVDAIESGRAAHFARYGTLSIRLNGRGSYRNCFEAIRRLRTSMPDIALTSFDLRSADVTSSTTVSFLFDLVWYTQPRQPAARK